MRFLYYFVITAANWWMKVTHYERQLCDHLQHDCQLYDRQLHDRQYYDRKNYGKPIIHNSN